jgi:hypothetical protein
MAGDDETKPAKRGRGRPPKAESDKKAPKRKAEPAVDGEGNPVAKKGRGRPPGKGKKAAKAKPAIKAVRTMSSLYKTRFFMESLNNLFEQTGKGRGRPKKNAEPEPSADEEEDGEGKGESDDASE